ncbi:MAG: IS200/IS605 family transposase [Catalinimonas sp.]
MPGTYSQINIQLVFAVKGRQKLLDAAWRQEVFRYMSSVITEKGQKALIVNGVADHVHVFVGLRPNMSVADLARDVKNNSSRFINQRGWVQGKFAWQNGYGAFSYGQSQVKRVYDYIARQEHHHRQRTFHDEYVELLDRFEIEYDERYL